MQEESQRDFLTGFLLRHTLDSTLQKLLFETEVKGDPLSVAIIDVDRFKKINDTFGHQYGDDALQYVAGILRSIFREGEYIFRYGGDEFFVVFPGKTSQQAAQILRLYNSFVRKEPFTCHDRIIKLTISCGVASFPRDGKTNEDLFRRADKALYFSKHCGRNYVTESHRITFLKFRNISYLILGIFLIVVLPFTINHYVFKGVIGKKTKKLFIKRSSLPAGVDSVTLKNGGVLWGTITSETEDKIVLQLDLGESQLSVITLNKSEITSFQRKSQ